MAYFLFCPDLSTFVLGIIRKSVRELTKLSKDDEEIEVSLVWEIAALYADAICAKREAKESYGKLSVTRIATTFKHFIDLWPRKSVVTDHEKISPGLKERLEKKHMEIWGYPITIHALIPYYGDDIVIGYSDPAIGNFWGAILKDNNEEVLAELPILTKRLNFFQEEDLLEETYSMIQILKDYLGDTAWHEERDETLLDLLRSLNGFSTGFLT